GRRRPERVHHSLARSRGRPHGTLQGQHRRIGRPEERACAAHAGGACRQGTMTPQTVVRSATASDVPIVLGMIRALADYEKLSHEVSATEDLVRESLFGPRPSAEALLAFEGETAVGFAVYFHTYSTFLARPGIHLEDLF